MVAVSLFGGDATVHELGDSSADPRSNLLVGGVGGVMLGLWLSGVFNPLLFVLNLLDKL